MRFDDPLAPVRFISSAAAILAIVLVISSSASAQAICSAPHSSPTLARSGSLRTLPPGAGWIQASLFGQRATRFFDARGDRQSFLAGSEFDTYSLFLSAAVGVTYGLEVWAQLPGTEFPVDATVLPLSEGQRDWEISLESGHFFQDGSLYVMGWLGYRCARRIPMSSVTRGTRHSATWPWEAAWEISPGRSPATVCGARRR